MLSFLILQQAVHVVTSWLEMANPHSAFIMVYGIHHRLFYKNLPVVLYEYRT
jgi:hypothetical protein